ncbi:MAG: PmoA family protein [Phycisphaeraceae bacterium]
MLLGTVLAFSATAHAQMIGTISVEAGDVQRLDQPVAVDLPSAVNAHRPLRLVERRDGSEHPVATQVERAHGDNPARLWFMLAGETEAGSSRHFTLSYNLPYRGESVAVAFDDQSVAMSLGGRTMFHYNHQHILPPEGVNSRFARSGYIHPVYSPSGLLVTEDFPDDHYHHKGVWFPWTRTEFDGNRIDFWNLGGGTGTVQHAGFETVTAGPVFGHVRARHEHVDLTQEAGKVALNETWDVRGWNAGGPEAGWWMWDLAANQSPASDSPLKLLEYHYGGLGFRGAQQWKDDNHTIITSEGHTKADGHTQRARWAAHGGEIQDGNAATVVILVHPSNERFPEPMRIWADGGAFFCFSPVQLGDWTLEPGNDYAFRYRFFIHEGAPDAQRAERAWQQFATPVKAQLELE